MYHQGHVVKWICELWNGYGICLWLSWLNCNCYKFYAIVSNTTEIVSNTILIVSNITAIVSSTTLMVSNTTKFVILLKVSLWLHMISVLSIIDDVLCFIIFSVACFGRSVIFGYYEGWIMLSWACLAQEWWESSLFSFSFVCTSALSHWLQ